MRASMPARSLAAAEPRSFWRAALCLESTATPADHPLPPFPHEGFIGRHAKPRLLCRQVRLVIKNPFGGLPAPVFHCCRSPGLYGSYVVIADMPFSIVNPH